MDQTPESPTAGRATGSAPASPRHSALAIIALVMALVPCCPPISLGAALLGLLAYRRIIASQGRLRGQGVAKAAIIAGIALSVLSVILWSRLANQYQQRSTEVMKSTVEKVIVAAMERRPAEVRERWTSAVADRPADEQIMAYGAELERRYGDFQRIAIVAESHSGFLTQRVQAAAIFHFRDAQLNGSFEADLSTQTMNLIPAFHLRYILIEDPDAGDLRLPPTNTD